MKLETTNQISSANLPSGPKNWAAPKMGTGSKRSRLSLRSESFKLNGNRGTLEIKLQTRTVDFTPISRRDQVTKRENFKTVFEAGLRA